MRRLADLADGISTLVFPRLCLNCRRAIGRAQREGLCLPCQSALPRTRNWELPENEMTDLFAGRLPVAHAAALYVYRSPSAVQEMIHALKYYHRPEIGRRLGRTLGALLRGQPHFGDLDALVPVPIHARRRLHRGYNQAEVIAEGLAESLGLPVLPGLLRRTDFQGSQTKKGQLERMENVADSFRVAPGARLPEGARHLLLVDDVLTTGATLDFCGNALLAVFPDCRISVATLGVTRRQ